LLFFFSTAVAFITTTVDTILQLTVKLNGLNVDFIYFW